jgi:hypothetical protein
MELGKANYSGGSGKTFFKMKDGNNIYRILPPLGSLAKDGHWRKYYTVVYGYKNSKGKMETFLDCRVVNFKTKMVEIESAAFLRSERVKKLHADLVKRYKEEKREEEKEEIAGMLKSSYEDTQRFNIESKYYVNAINLNGEIGLLKVGYKAMAQLTNKDKTGLIDNAVKSGLDPLSVEDGRFFNFYRTGKGRETQYTVSEYKEKVETKEYGIVEKLVKHVLTPDLIARLSHGAFDLAKLYPSPSPEQVQRIVNEGSLAVDEILGNRDNKENNNEDDTPDSAAEENTTTSSQTTNNSLLNGRLTDNVQPVVQPTVQPTVQLTPVTAPAVAPVTETKKVDSKPSDDDIAYLRSLGVNV